MALARVVTFDGVDSARIAELASNIENSEPPEGMPPSELMLLHDPESDRALAIVILDNEDDYAKAHAVLDSMPTDGTPGQRTSVTKYSVAARMS
ncbi:MAG TPA: hypothetical protein VMU72_03330 [Gaiellaceae bacterium]|nr:hypothetical protein [Gaiellaceae bacterium]